MSASTLIKSVTLTLSLVILLLLTTGAPTVIAIEFSEEFQNLGNWTIYRGPQHVEQILLDTRFGKSASSLNLPPAASLQPDPPGFGDDVASVYLSNPDTSKLANFTLSFWIYFDQDVGRAMVTFRMQDDRNFYGVLLTDTHDWGSRILKFSNDDDASLAETAPAVFAPAKWSHVKIEVQGQAFRVYKDGASTPILEASDGQWSSGRMLGIGLYNGYTYGFFHIDSLELVTTEQLQYMHMITETTTVTETIRTITTEIFHTSITEVSTEFFTSFSTITTTRTEEIEHREVVDVTSFRTTSVGVLTPILDLPTSFFVLLAGVAVGYWGKRRVRPLMAVVLGSVVAPVIFALFQAHLAWGMAAAGAFGIGIVIGVVGGAATSPVQNG